MSCTWVSGGDPGSAPGTRGLICSSRPEMKYHAHPVTIAAVLCQLSSCAYVLPFPLSGKKGIERFEALPPGRKDLSEGLCSNRIAYCNGGCLSLFIQTLLVVDRFG